jgi:hypothetical protein
MWAALRLGNLPQPVAEPSFAEGYAGNVSFLFGKDSSKRAERPMEKVKAHVKIQKHIYIHNEIDQAAFYFKERIEDRSAKGDRDGIGLEMMACLVLLAFAVEAKFNFLGYKLVENWNEWDPFLTKVSAVLKRLGIDDDLKNRPYKAIDDLQKFRNALAHGKPEEVKFEGEIVATKEELVKLGKLSAEYQAFLKEGLVFQAYEDVETIWRDLLERSGLNIADTITHGGLEYSIIKEEDDGG